MKFSYNRGLVVVATVLVLSSCGKPPLFNKHRSLRDVSFDHVVVLDALSNSFVFRWERVPTIDNLAVAEVVFDSDINLDIQMEADVTMPEMGHGSSPVLIERVDSRKFRISDISLFMSGLWAIDIKLIKLGKTLEVVRLWQSVE